MRARRTLAASGVGLLVAMGVAAWARPVIPAEPTDPSLALSARSAVPSPVTATLRRACFDCHSNETRWPLYSQVAPMSWLVAGHVRDGRDAFNYSEWTTYSSDDQDSFLGGMCSLPRRGRMPLPSYLLIHRDAKLSPADVTTLCTWSEKMRDTLQ